MRTVHSHEAGRRPRRGRLQALHPRRDRQGRPQRPDRGRRPRHQRQRTTTGTSFTHVVHRPPAGPRGAHPVPRPLLRRHRRPRRLPRRHVRAAHHPPERHRHLARPRLRHGVGRPDEPDASPSDEKLQILAFAYGYATHAAGDFFAHTLVNEFSEGVFPAVFDIVVGETADRDAGQRDPPPAARGLHRRRDARLRREPRPQPAARTATSAATRPPGIEYDAPMRFIYETLLEPFPGDPTSPADTGSQRDDHRRRARRTRSPATDGGSFLADDFQAGMQFFAFGFDDRRATAASSRSPTSPAHGRPTVDQHDRASCAHRGRHRRRGARRPRRPRPDPRPLLHDPARRSTTPLLRDSAARPARRSSSCSPTSSRCSTDGDPSTDPDALHDRRPRPGLPGPLDRRHRRRRRRVGPASAWRPRRRCSTPRRRATGRTSSPATTAATRTAPRTRPASASSTSSSPSSTTPTATATSTTRSSTNRVMPMLGLPRFVGELRTVDRRVRRRCIDDLVLAPSASSSRRSRAARRRQGGRQGLRHLGDRARHRHRLRPDRGARAHEHQDGPRVGHRSTAPRSRSSRTATTRRSTPTWASAASRTATTFTLPERRVGAGSTSTPTRSAG